MFYVNATKYEALLNKLDWKPFSQIAMEHRAILIFKHMKGRNRFPANAIAYTTPTLRRSTRADHGLELTMPVSSLKSIHSNSLNVAKNI
uniref:Uncharacterized protein n=1 Tax=Acrobeloides nanus TaxID=290746 RepID=A0A914E6D1_9BILA